MKFEYNDGHLWLGDCLELMKDIPDGSVDMILCDLPYGTTACKWDAVIPFKPLWEQYWRVAKPNAAIVLTASQPFTSALVMSNPNQFRYSWVWNKSHASNPLNAKKRPMQKHEDILIFASNGLPTYNPQMIRCDPFKTRTGKKLAGKKNTSEHYGQRATQELETKTERYPTTDLYYSTGARSKSLHPTQKPVALFEYLIKTYTKEGELVLDNCSGSGTTAIAARNTGRQWICIEQDEDYFEKSRQRIENNVKLENYNGY